MLNKEDEHNRKFILCTNNENGIAENICYPRIKKVIAGHKDHPSITKISSNLKYFKTDFVDAQPTDRNKRKLVDKSTEMLCLKEDCFEEVKKSRDFRLFTNNQGKHLGIIYDDDGIEPFKKEARKLKEKFIVYVFSLDESAREEEFEDITDLVELKPIPAVILNVYKRIFK
jgi:adenine-specific DNA-methyltransferase